MTVTPQRPDNAQELEPVAWGLFNTSEHPFSVTGNARQAQDWRDDYEGHPDISFKPLYSQATVNKLIKERDAARNAAIEECEKKVSSFLMTQTNLAVEKVVDAEEALRSLKVDT